MLLIAPSVIVLDCSTWKSVGPVSNRYRSGGMVERWNWNGGTVPVTSGRKKKERIKKFEMNQIRTNEKTKYSKS